MQKTNSNNLNIGYAGFGQIYASWMDKPTSRPKDSPFRELNTYEGRTYHWREYCGFFRRTVASLKCDDNWFDSDNYATLNADNPSPATGHWMVWSGGGTFADDTNPNTTVTGLIQGTNILRWTVTSTSNCPSSDDVYIYNDLPDVANAGENDTICSRSYTMDAVELSIGTGLWETADSDIVIDFPSLYNTDVSELNFGVNVFSWTTSNANCTSIDYVTIVNDSVSVANAGVDEYTCVDYALLCTAVPAFGTGIWDAVQLADDSNIVDPTNFCTDVIDLQEGQNVFRWTITSSTGECVSISYVSVFSLPVVADAGLDKELCDTDTFMTGSDPVDEFIMPNFHATGMWTQIPGFVPGVIDDPTAYNTEITDLDHDHNVFRWTVTNGHCTDWDEVDLIVYQPTTANADDDQIVCSYTTTLNANNANAAILRICSLFS